MSTPQQQEPQKYYKLAQSPPITKTSIQDNNSWVENGEDMNQTPEFDNNHPNNTQSDGNTHHNNQNNTHNGDGEGDGDGELPEPTLEISPSQGTLFEDTDDIWELISCDSRTDSQRSMGSRNDAGEKNDQNDENDKNDQNDQNNNDSDSDIGEHFTVELHSDVLMSSTFYGSPIQSPIQRNKSHDDNFDGGYQQNHLINKDLGLYYQSDGKDDQIEQLVNDQNNNSTPIYEKTELDHNIDDIFQDYDRDGDVNDIIQNGVQIDDSINNSVSNITQIDTTVFAFDPLGFSNSSNTPHQLERDGERGDNHNYNGYNEDNTPILDHRLSEIVDFLDQSEAIEAVVDNHNDNNDNNDAVNNEDNMIHDLQGNTLEMTSSQLRELVDEMMNSECQIRVNDQIGDNEQDGIQNNQQNDDQNDTILCYPSLPDETIQNVMSSSFDIDLDDFDTCSIDDMDVNQDETSQIEPQNNNDENNDDQDDDNHDDQNTTEALLEPTLIRTSSLSSLQTLNQGFHAVSVNPDTVQENVQQQDQIENNTHHNIEQNDQIDIQNDDSINTTQNVGEFGYPMLPDENNNIGNKVYDFLDSIASRQTIIESNEAITIENNQIDVSQTKTMIDLDESAPISVNESLLLSYPSLPDECVVINQDEIVNDVEKGVEVENVKNDENIEPQLTFSYPSLPDESGSIDISLVFNQIENNTTSDDISPNEPINQDQTNEENDQICFGYPGLPDEVEVNPVFDDVNVVPNGSVNTAETDENVVNTDISTNNVENTNDEIKSISSNESIPDIDDVTLLLVELEREHAELERELQKVKNNKLQNNDKNINQIDQVDQIPQTIKIDNHNAGLDVELDVELDVNALLKSLDDDLDLELNNSPIIPNHGNDDEISQLIDAELDKLGNNSKSSVENSVGIVEKDIITETDANTHVSLDTSLPNVDIQFTLSDIASDVHGDINVENVEKADENIITNDVPTPTDVNNLSVDLSAKLELDSFLFSPVISSPLVQNDKNDENNQLNIIFSEKEEEFDQEMRSILDSLDVLNEVHNAMSKLTEEHLATTARNGVQKRLSNIKLFDSVENENPTINTGDGGGGGDGGDDIFFDILDQIAEEKEITITNNNNNNTSTDLTLNDLDSLASDELNNVASPPPYTQIQQTHPINNIETQSVDITTASVPSSTTLSQPTSSISQYSLTPSTNSSAFHDISIFLHQSNLNSLLEPTPHHYHSVSNKTAQSLGYKKNSLDISYDYLKDAIHHDDPYELNLFIDGFECESMNSTFPNGFTFLQQAVVMNSVEVFDVLVNNIFVDVYAVTKWSNETVLSLALKYGKWRFVEKLLKDKINHNLTKSLAISNPRSKQIGNGIDNNLGNVNGRGYVKYLTQIDPLINNNTQSDNMIHIRHHKAQLLQRGSGLVQFCPFFIDIMGNDLLLATTMSEDVIPLGHFQTVWQYLQSVNRDLNPVNGCSINNEGYCCNNGTNVSTVPINLTWKNRQFNDFVSSLFTHHHDSGLKTQTLLSAYNSWLSEFNQPVVINTPPQDNSPISNLSAFFSSNFGSNFMNPNNNNSSALANKKSRCELIKDHLHHGQVIPIDVRNMIENRIQSLFQIFEFVFEKSSLFDRKNMLCQLYPRFLNVSDNKQIDQINNDQVDLYGIDLNRIGDRTIVNYTIFMLLVQTQQYQCLYRLIDNYKPYIMADVLKYVNGRGESLLSMLDGKLSEMQNRLNKNEYFYASLDDFSTIDFLPVDEDESHFLVDRANKQFVSKTIQLCRDIIESGQAQNDLALPTANQIREEVALKLQFFYHYDSIMMNQYPYHINDAAIADINEKNAIYSNIMLGDRTVNFKLGLNTANWVVNGEDRQQSVTNGTNENQDSSLLMYTNKNPLYHLCFDAYYKDSVVFIDAEYEKMMKESLQNKQNQHQKQHQMTVTTTASPSPTPYDKLFDSMISVSSHEQPLSSHHHHNNGNNRNQNRLHMSQNFSIISSPCSIALTDPKMAQKVKNINNDEPKKNDFNNSLHDFDIGRKQIRSISTIPGVNLDHDGNKRFEKRECVPSSRRSRINVFKSFDPFGDMIDPLFPTNSSSDDDDDDDNNDDNDKDKKNIKINDKNNQDDIEFSSLSRHKQEIALSVPPRNDTSRKQPSQGVLQDFFTNFLQNLNPEYRRVQLPKNVQIEPNLHKKESNNNLNNLLLPQPNQIPSGIKHTKDLIHYLKQQRFNAYPELKKKQILKIEERITLLEQKINQVHMSCENIAKGNSLVVKNNLKKENLNDVMAHGSVPSALTEYMLILTRKKIKYQAVLQALYGENPWDGSGNNNNNNNRQNNNRQNCRNNQNNGNLMFSTASNQNLSLEIAHEIEQDQIDDYDTQNQINYQKVQKVQKPHPEQLPISPLNVQDELSVVNYSQIDQDDRQQGHRFMLDGEFNVVDVDLLSPE